MKSPKKIGVSCGVAVCAAFFFPLGLSAQVAPQPVSGSERTAASADPGYLALGAEVLRLNERIAAMERIVSQMVSQQDENNRKAAQLVVEANRLRADLEARLTALEARPVPTLRDRPAPSQQQPEPLAQQAIGSTDRFAQAIAFAEQRDWSKAELALTTFIANNPGDPRIPQARYNLGLAYLGQEQPSQAARVFLDMFESGESKEFGALNLFALARALREIGNVDATEVCSVYAEIEVTYGEQLSAKQREDLLDQRLSINCTN
jgi:TolA-binding protein